MNTEVIELAPQVRYEACPAFRAHEHDLEPCDGCGWSADEHDAALAA